MPGAPLSSPTPTPSVAHSKTAAPTSYIVPILVSGILLVLLALMLVALHFRRHAKKKSSATSARNRREVQPGEIVSRAHPAALMITPADGQGTPRFVHTPGTNMRIATRRPDGAWEFADSRAPFTPLIIADAGDVTASESRDSAAYGSERYAARTPSPPFANNSPRSHANNRSVTSVSGVGGSTSDLVPPPTAFSASPWGAPLTPRTADSDLSPHSPWRAAYSPAPSTSAFASTSTISPPTAASSSRRNSAVSSNDSFLDLYPSDVASAHSESSPFLHRAPSPSPSPLRGGGAGARHVPASPSPLRSPRTSPEPAAAARVSPAPGARRGYELRDRPAPSAPASTSAYTGRPAYSPPLPLPPPPQQQQHQPTTHISPAARAKEAESRAARAIRQGYDRVDRYSEYAEEEDLPPY
ncbi:hypothetical protein GGX14DRAFT_643752 [Mycena pura]|uniref:Uncharacterized protein n=1 Tax=Mycena pura TaxID=153505 RepID=A0AAD6V8Z8_9AGAR|nr:hypothetical protein GGX14DRAFT_643752 [Mycena pura]